MNKTNKCAVCQEAVLFQDWEIYFGVCQKCQDKMDWHIEGYDDD